MKCPPNLTPETFALYCALRAAAMARPRRKCRAGCKVIPARPWDSSPDNGTAANALQEARRKTGGPMSEGMARRVKYGTPRVWTGPGRLGSALCLADGETVRGCDGRISGAYGERAARWIENPESKGLRFCGLAHDLRHNGRRGPVSHMGHWLDPDGGGESVSGVVYQLPGRKGRARFLGGYADPYNADKAGRGPAYLSLAIHESDGSDPADGEADAARTGDSMADAMAEEEREYQEAWRAGQEARGLAAAARAAWAAWVQGVRDLRAMVAAGVARDVLRRVAAGLRDDLEKARDALQEARDKRDESRPGPVRPHFRPEYAARVRELESAWSEGYDSGAF